MKEKVVKAVDYSVLKLMGVFWGDEVRWQEGYITLIQNVGPYFNFHDETFMLLAAIISIISVRHCHYLF